MQDDIFARHNLFVDTCMLTLLHTNQMSCVIMT